jgi:hypothetical protein
VNERIRECWLKAAREDSDETWDTQEQFIERFAEIIINECVACCGSQADMRNIRKRFGLPVESNVKYPGPEAIGHYSQYGREYNIPKE